MPKHKKVFCFYHKVCILRIFCNVTNKFEVVILFEIKAYQSIFRVKRLINIITMDQSESRTRQPMRMRTCYYDGVILIDCFGRSFNWTTIFIRWDRKKFKRWYKWLLLGRKFFVTLPHSDPFGTDNTACWQNVDTACWQNIRISHSCSGTCYIWTFSFPTLVTALANP